MKKRILSVTAVCLALVACNKDTADSKSSDFGNVTSMADLKVPDSFNWSASKTLVTDISVEGHEGGAMSKVRVDIYDVDAYEGGKVLWSGFTDADGRLEAPVKLPSSLTEVVVHAQAIGVGENRIKASVEGGKITAHFSGVVGKRFFDKTSSAGGTPLQATNFGASALGAKVWHLGPYNSNGVPAGMGSVSVSEAYVTHLNSMLPERNHLPCDPIRKHFLDDLYCNKVTTSKDDAEVWVTFLTEGAGYKNSLAYYYYPAGSPPASVNDIDSAFVVFPHLTHHDQILQPGDRVFLGTFPKNTVIEWVMIGRGWHEGNARVEHTSGTALYYGNHDFNTDQGYNESGCSDPTFNQHMISLTDVLNGEEIQIFAYEDMNYPHGDYDFNDGIFFASGDIYKGCAPNNALPSGAIADTDGDGIIDQLDDEPNNSNVACLIPYSGTLMFEDLWPAKGDYDFNDLVTTYDITHAIHADGYVHEVRTDYTIKAAGAGYNNGFGTFFPNTVNKTDVASISGRTSFGTFPTDGDLTAVPDPAEVVVYNWDGVNNLITNDISGGQFFNTINGGGKGQCVTENIVITMAPDAVSQWELGLPPYNAFIFSNQDQTREIHLADMAPSSIHEDSRFGTSKDDSDPVSGRYYKTAAPNNLPWALDIPKNMNEWPLERVEIITAFPQFAAWASSGGVSNPDWYDHPTAGQTYVGCP